MECVSMKARVLRAQNSELTVYDCCSRQKVLVRADNIPDLRAGDQVLIRYNGIMTMSIPPQINAACITKLC